MRHTQGFSLIESLTTLIIITIISVFALSNMRNLLKSYQSYVISTELYLLVLHARTYAANYHKPLTLCGSNNGNTCDNQWSVGALLFEDANRNGIKDNADLIISYQPFNLKNAKLTWKGFSGSRLIFESIGITYTSNGTFTYCQLDNDPIYSRQVIVNRGGRPRKSIDKNGDGLHENSSGQPINCSN